MDSFMQVSPLSTLESSYETLTIKKLDGTATFYILLLAYST